MSQFVAALHALLVDPQVVSAILTAILGFIGVVVFSPNGVVSVGLKALGSALMAKLQRRLPSTAYQIVQNLATDACRVAYQFGKAQGLDDPSKAQAAVDHLAALIQAHLKQYPSLAAFNVDTTLRALVEQAWSALKLELPGTFYGLPDDHPLPADTAPVDAPASASAPIAPAEFTLTPSAASTTTTVEAPAVVIHSVN